MSLVCLAQQFVEGLGATGSITGSAKLIAGHCFQA